MWTKTEHDLFELTFFDFYELPYEPIWQPDMTNSCDVEGIPVCLDQGSNHKLDSPVKLEVCGLQISSPKIGKHLTHWTFTFNPNSDTKLERPDTP